MAMRGTIRAAGVVAAIVASTLVPAVAHGAAPSAAPGPGYQRTATTSVIDVPVVDVTNSDAVELMEGYYTPVRFTGISESFSSVAYLDTGTRLVRSFSSSIRGFTMEATFLVPPGTVTASTVAEAVVYQFPRDEFPPDDRLPYDELKAKLQALTLASSVPVRVSPQETRIEVEGANYVDTGVAYVATEKNFKITFRHMPALWEHQFTYWLRREDGSALELESRAMGNRFSDGHMRGEVMSQFWQSEMPEKVTIVARNESTGAEYAVELRSLYLAATPSSSWQAPYVAGHAMRLAVDGSFSPYPYTFEFVEVLERREPGGEPHYVVQVNYDWPGYINLPRSMPSGTYAYHLFYMNDPFRFPWNESVENQLRWACSSGTELLAEPLEIDIVSSRMRALSTSGSLDPGLTRVEVEVVSIDGLSLDPPMSC